MRCVLVETVKRRRQYIGQVEPETNQSRSQLAHSKMRFFYATIVASAAAQTLNIPTRSGNINSLSSPSVISGAEDFNNQEFDRGQPCNSDEDTGDENAVFILEDGASIANVIIGGDSLEGVHCEGACTLTNVWFRDVCEGKRSDKTQDQPR